VVEFSPDGIEGEIVPSLIYNGNLGRYEEFVRQAKQQVRNNRTQNMVSGATIAADVEMFTTRVSEDAVVIEFVPLATQACLGRTAE
jgi:hypothetical protein